MTQKELDALDAERTEAIKSLDRDKLIAFFSKFPIVTFENEEAMFAGVHKARLYLPFISAEDKDLSRQWLADHGYSTNISWLDAVKN